MNQQILYLFTRTPLHVGAGASVGAVDQPVQRERHTGFPVIPGSSIKGVLADTGDYADVSKDDNRSELGHKLFGRGAGKEKGDSGSAGGISIAEAQLLAFPVRSARGCFAWLTSPLCLARWSRVSGVSLPDISDPSEGQALFDGEVLGHDGKALFEDYVFNHEASFPAAEALAGIAVDGIWADLAEKHLVLVSDDILSHFARHACEVAQHVVIDNETGTAKNGLLFNQENVPAETLFFATISATKDPKLLKELNVPNPIQLGGDATTGLGFCSSNLV